MSLSSLSRNVPERAFVGGRMPPPPAPLASPAPPPSPIFFRGAQPPACRRTAPTSRPRPRARTPEANALSSGDRSLTAATISSRPSPFSFPFSSPSAPAESNDRYDDPSAGWSCSLTRATSAATCAFPSVPGTSPVASAPRSSPAIASGSRRRVAESPTRRRRDRRPPRAKSVRRWTTLLLAGELRGRGVEHLRQGREARRGGAAGPGRHQHRRGRPLAGRWELKRAKT